MFEVNDRVKLRKSSVYRHNPDDSYEIVGFHMDFSFGTITRGIKIRNIKTNECVKTFEKQLELDNDYYRKLKLKKICINLSPNKM